MTNTAEWLNADSRIVLERGYLKPGVTPEERIRQISDEAGRILKDPTFPDRFYNNMMKGWYSLASPIWSNFGLTRGLPISCNGSFIPDTTCGILDKVAEVGMQTKHGAGTSAYFGALRGRGSAISIGGQSMGSVHFMELFQSVSTIISQGNTRRGFFAAYLPVDHPDILEFLTIKEEGHPIQQISIGVCISDEWMESMVGDKEKGIKGDSKKRELWGLILKKRFQSGYPYIFFTDTVNKNKPQVYKDKNMQIYASNLCSEIQLPSSEDESFVCNLSSMNVLHWDDWKDTDAVELLTMFLDAVMSEYIEKTESIPHMLTAHNFAKRHRALGVGVLGWHSFLQSKMIPFESFEAKTYNVLIFQHINEKTLLASQKLAERLGEPEILKGYGLRNTTRMAVAPTTTSAFILGQVSQSVEPFNSNFYTKDIAKGKFPCKNVFLAKVLDSYKKNTKAVWNDILQKGGSVQHLDFLTDHEKSVFKTFGEISQKEIVIQAYQRQLYIDQGQSLNLMVHPGTKPSQMSELLIEAWRMGIKTIYYQRGTNAAQELNRNILSCVSCES